MERKLLVLGADPPTLLRLAAFFKPGHEIVPGAHDEAWRAFLTCRHSQPFGLAWKVVSGDLAFYDPLRKGEQA